MSTNLSALFESANLGELSVGRSLRTGALAIIADGDTVICEFPGEHNFCTEHPEYAQLFVAALNAMPKLLDENYKFKHQVRDTCVRAESAEKSLRAQPQPVEGGESAEPPSDEVWPPDGAIWLAPVATDAPANPKLMQYAWGRSSLSSGQMAEAYQCIVSAAQECGQVYRLPVAAPAQPDGVDKGPVFSSIERDSPYCED